MRDDKKYLVQETTSHLDKSDYVILADFQGMTVEHMAQLRKDLSVHEAEFHVIKNRIFKVAAKDRDMPVLDDHLKGPTAIVVGGKNPSEVAKVVKKFQKANDDKGGFKAGALGVALLSADDVKALADLPSMDALRGQLLGLLSTPAQQMVRVLNAVPQNVLNVLQAKADKGE